MFVLSTSMCILCGMLKVCDAVIATQEEFSLWGTLKYTLSLSYLIFVRPNSSPNPMHSTNHIAFFSLLIYCCASCIFLLPSSLYSLLPFPSTAAKVSLTWGEGLQGEEGLERVEDLERVEGFFICTCIVIHVQQALKCNPDFASRLR